MYKNLNFLKAEVWSQANCQYCDIAKNLLDRHAINYVEKMIGVNGYTKKDLLEKVPTARSVPQIFLNKEYIGGLQELKTVLERYDNAEETKMG